MGIIVVADDQAINLEALKISLKAVELFVGSEFYINGQQVIDRVKVVVEDTLRDAKRFPVRPISALILDFQMPHKNGLEVVLEVK